MTQTDSYLVTTTKDGTSIDQILRSLHLLLLGRGAHILVEGAIRHLEATEGLKTDTKDRKHDEESNEAHEDT